LSIHEFESVPARKALHLLESLDRHQGGQRLALPLDDEFVLPEGNAIQHVADALPNVHRGNPVSHRNSINYNSCW
jgi:hypothetical protein